MVDFDSIEQVVYAQDSFSVYCSIYMLYLSIFFSLTCYCFNIVDVFKKAENFSPGLWNKVLDVRIRCNTAI